MVSWRVIAIVVILCIAAILYGIWAETHGQEPPTPDNVPTAFYPAHEVELLKLEREAIAAAYKQQVQSLYLNWMKDPKDQPARAHRGANQAKDAYVRAMEAIDRREDAGRKMIRSPPAGFKQ